MTKTTRAVQLLLSVKKTGEDTNQKVTEVQPQLEELHANMHGNLDKQMLAAENTEHHHPPLRTSL